MSRLLRHRYGHVRRAVDPARLTERGLAALAAARRGAPLYVFKNGSWRAAGPRALASAERLALRSPQSLVMFAAERP
jgi:hypothetical protein